MNRCTTNARSAVLRGCLLAAIAAAAAPAMGAARLQNGQAAAAPQPAGRLETGRCSGEPAKPAKLALQIGKSSMLRLPEPVQNRSVGNPAVVQALQVAPDTLYIAGVDVGTTNMIVQGRSGTCSVVDIVVSMDPAALQATLAEVMPEEKNIRVLAAADSLVLTGMVSDASIAARAVELAEAYVRHPLRPLPVSKEDAAGMPLDAKANQTTGVRIVNMLSVSAPQQVQLEVKVAEVSKTLIERLETGANWSFGSGSWVGALITNYITGKASGGLGYSKSNGNRVVGQAEKQDGIVRVLAEPNIMAVSGQEGTFLAGGKFYIPVAQDNNRITLAEKEFGVGLRFTPTVLSGGRISLQVAPEVSELSRDGIGISAAGFNGSTILPVITTRRATTTVQLYDGQSFAIGGLIKNNLVTNLKGLPMLGQIPVLGALFRSTDYQQDRTELVFVITPRLVKPQPSTNYVLPTDKVGEPSPAAVLLGGRLDGRGPAVSNAAASAPPMATTAQSAGGFELK